MYRPSCSGPKALFFLVVLKASAVNLVLRLRSRGTCCKLPVKIVSTVLRIHVLTGIIKSGRVARGYFGGSASFTFYGRPEFT